MSTAAWHTSRSTANKWVLRVFSQPGCRIIDDADGGIRIPALHLAGGGDGGGGSSSGGRERLTFELLGMLKCESSKVRTARTLARSRPCMHACTLAHARARFAQTQARDIAHHWGGNLDTLFELEQLHHVQVWAIAVFVVPICHDTKLTFLLYVWPKKFPSVSPPARLQ